MGTVKEWMSWFIGFTSKIHYTTHEKYI